jgi:hypothetical protein
MGVSQGKSPRVKEMSRLRVSIDKSQHLKTVEEEHPMIVHLREKYGPEHHVDRTLNFNSYGDTETLFVLKDLSPKVNSKDCPIVFSRHVWFKKNAESKIAEEEHSVAVIYIEHLKTRRNILATFPPVEREVVPLSVEVPPEESVSITPTPTPATTSTTSLSKRENSKNSKSHLSTPSRKSRSSRQPSPRNLPLPPPRPSADTTSLSPLPPSTPKIVITPVGRDKSFDF